MRVARTLASMRMPRAYPLLGSRSGFVPTTSSALRCEVRCIHRHHSPDRSHMEEIQDRQNSFRWSAQHVFRPHQHFTYDPASWSRPLEEQVKKTRELSLLQRLKMSAEHAAESTGNAKSLEEVTPGRSAATQEAVGSPSEEELPDYFFATTDALGPQESGAVSKAPSYTRSLVSLQELVEEAQRLQRLLHSPRFGSNASLERRGRQEADYQFILLHLYERLRSARADETVTADACAFGWFLLMRGIEPLLVAMTRTRQEGRIPSSLGEGSEEEAAIHDVFNALRMAVLEPMEENTFFFVAASTGKLSLEALIELLSIATSPFVRRYTNKFAESGSLTSGTLVRYIACISTAARQREHGVVSHAEGDEPTAAQEWLDPMHLAAWALALRRMETCESAILPALSVLELHVHHAAVHIMQLLRTVTGVTSGGHVAASLSRQKCRSTPTTSVAQPGRAPKPVYLDETAAPHGVQTPPTESDDTMNILVAATAAVQLRQHAASSGVPREEKAQRIVSACLRMLSHTPNYDLCADDVVAWACEVLEAGYLIHMEEFQSTACAVGELTSVCRNESLRFMLLLSRLSYGSVMRRSVLGRLILSVCRWPEPSYRSDKELLEWRRLRGVFMRGALSVLHVPDLVAGASELGSDGAVTWLETVAFGEYGGTIPMALWRDAAVFLFPKLLSYCEGGTAEFSALKLNEDVSRPRCRPEEAHALCILCARYTAEGKPNVSTPTNFHSIFTARCIAECLAVMLECPALPEQLLSSASAWDGLCTSLPEEVQHVATHMQEVVRREASSSTKVISF